MSKSQFNKYLKSIEDEWEINEMGHVTLHNLNLPFDEAIAAIHNDKISDGHFNTALDEFNIDEGEAMKIMINSLKYEFTRVGDGWIINKK